MNQEPVNWAFLLLACSITFSIGWCVAAAFKHAAIRDAERRTMRAAEKLFRARSLEEAPPVPDALRRDLCGEDPLRSDFH